jgi:hypothetical protein
LIFRRLYAEKVAKFDVFTKEFREFIRDFNFWVQNGFQTKSIWVGPVMPSKKTSLYKIAGHLKLSIRQKNSKNHLLHIWFQDQTKSASHPSISDSDILNIHCTDISKKNVEKLHEKIWGYGMEIDPKTHQGKCVIKSDENAVHDGHIVQCPVADYDPTKVYQIVINNEDSGEFFDYRVAVMKQEVVIIYKKYKTPEKRFTNDTHRAEIASLEIIPIEIKNKIVLFCNEIQCDFCELDVLFDQDSQKWFVIDVNKTPYGPPASLTALDKEKAVTQLSNGFQRNFLQ